jgi:methionyl-tRNA synthetase
MLGSYFDGVVPEGNVPGAAGRLPALARDVAARYDRAVEEVALSAGVAAVWELVHEANRYLVETSPWAVAKDTQKRDELGAILYASAEVLRILAVLVFPVMPGAAVRLWSQLGMERPLEAERLPRAAAWGGLEAGTRTTKREALFPRLES